MATYKKEEVTIVGDLRQGDPGFDANKPQVRIKRKDGTEEVVPKDQVNPPA